MNRPVWLWATGGIFQVQIPLFYFHRKRPGDYSCPFRILSSTMLALIAAWNIGGEPFEDVDRFKYLGSISSRTWGAEVAYQRLNCGAVSASPAYRAARPKKASLAWSCCKAPRSWADPLVLYHLTRCARSNVAKWRRGQPRSRQTWSPYQGRESSANQDGEWTGRTPIVSLHRTAEPGVPGAISLILYKTIICLYH